MLSEQQDTMINRAVVEAVLDVLREVNYKLDDIEENLNYRMVMLEERNEKLERKVRKLKK